MKKIKNRQSQNLKKAQKQKKRQERIRKQTLSKQETSPQHFVEAYYNLGVTYQKQLKIADMIETYRKVVKIGEPDSYAVHHAQDMLSSLEKQMLNDEGVDLDGFLKGEQAFEQGMKHAESKDWDEAIAKFNDAIKINQNRPQVYGNLGICYAIIGEIQSALECFDRAIEIDPNYEPALLNRKIVEALKTGERLNPKIETIEYYKDYPIKNRSYIQEIIKEQNILPEKI
ncbi:tetratricopeptide repeat protein [uncultured Desulfobacter sp.]|uniref:tetratricopeptide repeat protein n=1 Tax=uncultured Desulfobacter sp. TaxID=240139 RepID=UPI002AABF87E|nr:tetratricopeptide repeat protein [uncultured Desulfobacter sp.]